MKTCLPCIWLWLTLLALSGCSRTEFQTNNPPPPATADAVTLAEIDAAAGLTMDNNRLDSLKAIAARATLTTSAQMHLVEKAFHSLTFENSKLDLLTVLIKNPAFSNAGKQAILNDLGQLTFENSKTTILAQLNARGDLKD